MVMQYKMNKSLLRAKNMLSRQKMRLIFTALLFCTPLSFAAPKEDLSKIHQQIQQQKQRESWLLYPYSLCLLLFRN